MTWRAVHGLVPAGCSMCTSSTKLCPQQTGSFIGTTPSGHCHHFVLRALASEAGSLFRWDIRPHPGCEEPAGAGAGGLHARVCFRAWTGVCVCLCADMCVASRFCVFVLVFVCHGGAVLQMCCALLQEYFCLLDSKSKPIGNQPVPRISFVNRTLRGDRLFKSDAKGSPKRSFATADVR